METNKRFFLAWQEHKTRAWFPIGRLDAAKDSYSFGYTKGALEAHEEYGFSPAIDFPDFQTRYHSDHLFPLFSNRAMSKGRTQEYLKLINLDKLSSDLELGKLEMLAVDGGYRATDEYHVFPDIKPNAEGCFTTRFFIHGWGHTNEDTKRVIGDPEALKKGDELYVSVELNNPTGIAVMLHSGDYHTLGWSPRYLAHDLVKAMASSPTASEITATVVQINPAPAPSKQRVLVELSARFPLGYKPLDEEQFELIIPS